MKPPIAKLKPELKFETARAAERFVEVELNPATVRIKMFEVAKLGHTALRIHLPVQINLQKSEAVKVFLDWCQDNGFSVTWESAERVTPDGRRIVVREPEVSW